MTFVQKHRFGGARTEQALLKMSWEGELFGVGLFEALTEMFPEHAEELTACATMEWFNVHYCEHFGHDAGMHVSLDQAERLGREGAWFARRLRTFKSAAKLTIEETREADALYKLLGKNARTPELRALADDLYEHENAMRDWFQSELDGMPDGGDKIFAYLERHGITRGDAVTPRKRREDVGGDTQQLVLAFFANEDAADQAAKVCWEVSSEAG